MLAGRVDVWSIAHYPFRNAGLVRTSGLTTLLGVPFA
jgi:hypothetical protein